MPVAISRSSHAESEPGRSLSRRSAILRVVSLLPWVQLVQGQEAQKSQDAPATFSTNVKVVSVLASVQDKQGHIIRDLTKDDFALAEDGHPQIIQYFSQQTALPLMLGLLVDTSGSERRMIGTEKDASHTFIQQVLRPDKDKVFLIHFDRDVELLQDLTSSRERFEKALDQLEKPEWSGSGNSGQSGGSPQGGNGGYGGGRQGRGGGGTALYDAIYLASGDVLKNQSGRKALIMLTDGEDRGSKTSLAEAITTAQRSDTLVYSVRIADEEQSSPFGGFGGPGMGRHGGMGGGGMGRGGGGPYGRGQGERPDGQKILQQISRETGGGYFEVSKKKTVSDIFQQIEEELRNQYSLGYTPTPPDDRGGYHKLQLTLRTGKNLVVRTRDGYYSQA